MRVVMVVVVVVMLMVITAKISKVLVPCLAHCFFFHGMGKDQSAQHATPTYHLLQIPVFLRILCLVLFVHTVYFP